MCLSLAGYFTAVMKQPIGLSTGRRRSLAEIEKILARDREAYLRSRDSETVRQSPTKFRP